MAIGPGCSPRALAHIDQLGSERELPATLQQAVVAARQLLDVDTLGPCRPTATASCASQASDQLAQATQNN
jgi:hypothetical protein